MTLEQAIESAKRRGRQDARHYGRTKRERNIPTHTCVINTMRREYEPRWPYEVAPDDPHIRWDSIEGMIERAESF